MLTREYVAGFFDGEGHLGITCNRRINQYTLRLVFTNTDINVLQMIKLKYGGSLNSNSTSRSWTKSYRPEWKKSYNLKLGIKDIRILLDDIKDLVIVKAPQVKLAYEFMEYLKSSNRFEIKDRKFGACRVRTDESINREGLFKDQMHLLNKCGS